MTLYGLHAFEEVQTKNIGVSQFYHENNTV